MKIFTKTLILILSCFSIGNSQTQIGFGSDENQRLPIEPYYNFSFTQSIYLKSEINTGGMITSIQYYYSGSTNLETTDDDVQIWMGHTSKTSFTSNTDWVSVNDITQVFNGTIPAPNTPGIGQWITIPLSVAFPYNNIDNLIIAIDANEDGYDNVHDDFHCSSITNDRSIFFYSDTDNPDPAGLPTANGTTNYIPNIILDFTSCEKDGTGDQSYSYANSYDTDGPSYSWIDPVASGHTEITAMTSGSDDDGYLYVANMGITFNYYGDNNYTDCYIGTNGYVSFGAGFTTTATSSTIPSSSDPDNMIAACMMDLDDRTDGQIFYGLSGGNFVITWLKYHDYFDDDEWISFQVILEGDDDGGFTIQYNDALSSSNMPDILTDAVVGAEFGDSEGVVYRTNGSGGPIFCSPIAVGFSKAPLPIDLLSFEGKAMKNDNKLMWVTAMEDNTEWHIIERSLDGRTKWEEIGRLSAQGFSQNDISYELNDKNPMLKGYYRLKSVDYDGQFEISDIITIRRNSTSDGIRVFPNPTKGITNIEFTVDYANLTDINITDISGKLISTSTFDAKAGINKHAIDMSKLSKGVYFISIFNGTENVTQKVVKF